MYRVFVINLKKDKNRRDTIVKQLDDKNIDFEIVDGVYGKDLSESDIEDLSAIKESKKKMGKEISLNEIGCSLSHQRIYKKIIEDDLNGAFIFEDDVILSQNSKNIMDTIYANIKNIEQGCWINLNSCYIDTKNKIYDIDSNQALHRSVRVKNACSYYIDKAAANKLISYNTPIIYVADWFFGGYINNLNLYGLSQACVIQNPIAISTISETRKKNNNITESILVYIKKTIIRFKYYTYIFKVFSGRYKKTLPEPSLINN